MFEVRLTGAGAALTIFARHKTAIVKTHTTPDLDMVSQYTGIPLEIKAVVNQVATCIMATKTSTAAACLNVSEGQNDWKLSSAQLRPAQRLLFDEL